MRLKLPIIGLEEPDLVVAVAAVRTSEPSLDRFIHTIYTHILSRMTTYLIGNWMFVLIISEEGKEHLKKNSIHKKILYILLEIGKL